MVSPVSKEGNDITYSHLFHIGLKEILTGNSTKRGYIAITISIISIGF